ncbi:MAG: bifunctional UDP-sugar hydrolase/5'-nucleotidase [Victivallaceae bacterium]
MNKFIIIGLLLALSAVNLCAEIVKLTVLNTTDTHAHVSGKNSGWTKLATLIREQQTLAGGKDKTLLIDCGDTLQGTQDGALTQGSIAIKIMNNLDYDVWVPGNHDFEFGLSVLKKRIAEFHGAVLAANMICPTLNGVYKPWKMFKINGLKVAVIGVTLPGMSNQILQPQSALTTIQEGEAIAECISSVRKSAPDIIILAQHQGMYGKKFNIFKLAGQYPEIDLILTGHTHQEQPGIKINSSGWLVQAGKHSKTLGVITFEYDTTHKKTVRISSKLLPVSESTPEDRRARQIADTETVYKRKVGEVMPLLSSPRPKTFESGITTLATLAMAETAKVDIAVFGMNCGEFTVFEKTVYEETVFRFFPFQDTLCTIELSLDELKTVMNEQIVAARKKYYSPMLYGAKIIIDKNWNAVKIIPGKTQSNKFKVAFSSYTLAGGGGKFPQLARLAREKSSNLQNDEITIRECVSQYIKKHSPLKLEPHKWLYHADRKE